MNLQLSRPLVFFDLETTGVSVSKDRIVEISLVKLFEDGHRESLTYRVCPTQLRGDGMPIKTEVGEEIPMPIPADSTKVHHITDEDVASCPTFTQLAPTVINYIRGCDLAGYNSNHFDIPMLQEELIRAGQDYDLLQESKMVDIYVIFQKHTPRSLSACYMHYCGKSLENAHSASADTEATYEVLMAQLEQHDDVPTTVDRLHQYTTRQTIADLAGHLVLDDNKDVVFNFGRHKGKRLKEVFATDTGYYGWLMNSDFPLYTKKVVKNIFNEYQMEQKLKQLTNKYNK